MKGIDSDNWHASHTMFTCFQMINIDIHLLCYSKHNSRYAGEGYIVKSNGTSMCGAKVDLLRLLIFIWHNKDYPLTLLCPADKHNSNELARYSTFPILYPRTSEC